MKLFVPHLHVASDIFGTAVGALSKDCPHLKQTDILARLMCSQYVHCLRPNVNTPNGLPQLTHFFDLRNMLYPQFGHGFFLPVPMAECLKNRKFCTIIT